MPIGETSASSADADDVGEMVDGQQVQHSRDAQYARGPSSPCDGPGARAAPTRRAPHGSNPVVPGQRAPHGISDEPPISDVIPATSSATSSTVDSVPDSEALDAVEIGVRLILRVRAGNDPIAMHDLLRFLEPYIGRWCGPIALQDGPDAVQETLLIVFRSLDQLKEPAALLGWVRAIAVREAIKLAAKASRTNVAELTELPSRAEMETVSDVHDVLRRLSPEHRAILVLRDLERLDERSVASILNVSIGTVKSRLFRARLSFRHSWT